jgi:hypothetical protein
MHDIFCASFTTHHRQSHDQRDLGPPESPNETVPLVVLFLRQDLSGASSSSLIRRSLSSSAPRTAVTPLGLSSAEACLRGCPGGTAARGVGFPTILRSARDGYQCWNNRHLNHHHKQQSNSQSHFNPFRSIRIEFGKKTLDRSVRSLLLRPQRCQLFCIKLELCRLKMIAVCPFVSDTSPSFIFCP